MRRNITTGLDVGTSTIRVVVIEKKKGDSNPQILAAHECPSVGIKHGYVVDFNSAVESIKKCIREAEKKSKVAIKSVYLGIGGISLSSTKNKGTVMISKADGEVGDYDIKRAITISEESLPDIINRNIIHTTPIGFKIDNTAVLGKPTGLKGKKLEVDTLFITALSQHLDDLIKVVEEAGLVINDVIASPIAESFAILNRQQKNVGVLLANIGAETVSITVFENNMPYSLEVFPIGSSHITQDIALGMRIPLDEAEKLKFGEGVEKMSKRKLTDIIEARLGDIFELIESHLKKINKNGLLPAGIILTGSGSNLANLDEIAKSTLKLPAKSIVTSFSGKEGGRVNDIGFSVAYGLCIMGTTENDSDNVSIEITRRTKNLLARFFRSLVP